MTTIDVTYAQTQPRTVEGGLRPHPSKTGLRPEPDLEQLESAEQIDSFVYLGCGVYLESLVRERTLKNIDQVTFSRNILLDIRLTISSKKFRLHNTIKIISKIISKIIYQVTQLRQHKRRNHPITSR